MKKLSTNIIKHVCKTYGIGRLLRWKHADAHLQKLDTLIETSTGKYFFKDCGSSASVSHTKLELISQVISLVKLDSIPVPALILTSSGYPWCQIAEHLFLLSPLLNGKHLHGSQMNSNQVRCLGTLIARLHLSLDALQAMGREIQVDELPTDNDTLQFIEKFDQNLTDDDPVRPLAQLHFDLIRQCIEREQVISVPKTPTWLIHGDLTPSNVLWNEDNVVAILDWDTLRISTRALEIGYLLYYFFGNEWPKTIQFLHAYHEILPLSETEISSLADTFFQYQIHNTWSYSYYLATREPLALKLAQEDYDHLQWLMRNRDSLHTCLSTLLS